MLRILTIAILLLCGAQVFAQSLPIDTMNDRTGYGDSYTSDRAGDANRWRVLVGAGAAVFPTYSGSDDYKGGLAPLIHASYGRFFAGVGGVGVDLFRDHNWRINVHLSGSRGRKQSDDSDLRGLGDVDSTLRGGVSARYAEGHFAASVQILSDLLGRDQGTVARVDAYARFMPVSRLIVLAGPGITWANGRYSRTYFGVDALQHANSGLPQFDADAGFNSVRLSASAIYLIDRHWFAMASAAASQLQGDAVKSPITRSRSQNSLLIAGAYVF